MTCWPFHIQISICIRTPPPPPKKIQLLEEYRHKVLKQIVANSMMASEASCSDLWASAAAWPNARA